MIAASFNTSQHNINLLYNFFNKHSSQQLTLFFPFKQPLTNMLSKGKKTYYRLSSGDMYFCTYIYTLDRGSTIGLSNVGFGYFSWWYSRCELKRGVGCGNFNNQRKQDFLFLWGWDAGIVGEEGFCLVQTFISADWKKWVFSVYVVVQFFPLVQFFLNWYRLYWTGTKYFKPVPFI